MPEFDDVDRQLLRMLREDGRRTFSEMAPEVGLSVAAVKRRVDRLKDSGVIKAFTVQIDHTKLGWGIEAFVEPPYTGTHRSGRSSVPPTRSPRCRPSSPSPATPTPW
ncbi:hypothetical protein SANTM175S_04238 [Streptomyces antimycoticus]